MSFALQGVVKQGTGQNALSLGRPAAGKTGTATNADGNVSSSWFVGYTPQLSTAVMYVRGDGNDNLNCKNKNGKNCDPGYLVPYFGAEYPTRTWTDVMRMSLDDAPVEQFPPPANVEATKNDHVPLPTFTPEPTPTPTPTKKPSKTPTDPHAHPRPRPPRRRRRRPPRRRPPSPRALWPDRRVPATATGTAEGVGDPATRVPRPR